jgi:hypothetical protein
VVVDPVRTMASGKVRKATSCCRARSCVRENYCAVAMREQPCSTCMLICRRLQTFSMGCACQQLY